MTENQRRHERYIFLKFLVVFLGGGVAVFLIKNESIPGISLLPDRTNDILFLLALFILIGISFYFAKDIRGRYQPYCPCLQCKKERDGKQEDFLKNTDGAHRKMYAVKKHFRK